MKDCIVRPHRVVAIANERASAADIGRKGRKERKKEGKERKREKEKR
ncbi:MAG: hypothetical protein ACTS4U_01150 [Candidatus Hodgkinia cicadicola]